MTLILLPGPSETAGTDVDSCYDFTTTTEISTSPTTSTTSRADQCDQFLEGSCDIDESNTLDLLHDLRVGDCQDLCLSSRPCHWFTWYNVSGIRLSLLGHSDRVENMSSSQVIDIEKTGLTLPG